MRWWWVGVLWAGLAATGFATKKEKEELPPLPAWEPADEALVRQGQIVPGMDLFREDIDPSELPVPPPEPLLAPVIDSHCHLDITTEYSGLAPEAALAAAAAVGVTGVVEVGVDLPSSQRAAVIAAELPQVVAAVALHPNEAPGVCRSGELEQQLSVLAELVQQPNVVAVGETGMD